ncbi:MAG: hypothetical protein IPL58_04165 [Betaproteobacteria bacterium]|jgi:hypothetical protein|uniref:Uncharacterized protein n=1 Tax=Candidatus Proximibacter danicus TaxID=2954365 RepID=A0A9D7PR45_9PROT|nr:hypothetical protein [Candidatus Proximibacter danicus]
MKPIHLIAAVTLSMSGLTFAAGGHDHGHEHKPLHGGVVSEVKDMDYELVAKPDLIQLYLRDHGKPMDISKASAKLTILVGAEKQEVELKPAGRQLEAAGNFKLANSKIVALVSVPGKAPATVRFVLK